MIPEGPLPPSNDILFFPVRHHSPASARFAVELIHRTRPTAVLIEGPADFNPKFDELFLDHTLPIALYAYVRLSDDSRRSAFYPFCDFSPEWQALLAAREIGAHVEFIDLAWDRMVDLDTPENRYSDDHFRVNPYPEMLAQKMNLSGFDEVWDALFELDPHLDLPTYIDRAQTFCTHLRLFSGPDTPENQAREAFMASRIQDIRARTTGPIVVVTGGFHSLGLWSILNQHPLTPYDLTLVPRPIDPDAPTESKIDPAPESTPDSTPETPPAHIVDQGITLTPFTYERVDRLNGYAAGLNGPAFYEHVWHRRLTGQPLDGHTLIKNIVQQLRDKGQLASTADFISITTTAQSLANLRGRREIWRTDILDALSAALIKEHQDAQYMHPVLVEARKVFQGQKRGAVSKHASLPPLVHNTRAELETQNLSLPEKPTQRRLNLEDPLDHARSHTLHRCRALKLSGIRFLRGTDFVRREDLSALWEEWELRWLPEFEGDLIEAAVYGPDLAVAAAASLLEIAADPNLSLEDAAAIAVDAALMNLRQLATPLFETITQRCQSAQDFFDVAAALAHILFLFHHDDIVAGGASLQARELLHHLYHRALWLFESLGVVKDRDQDLLRATGALFDTHHRTFRESKDDHDQFTTVFTRIGDDPAHMPLTRGCGHGGAYALGAIQTDRVLAALLSFVDPMELGDYLIGFFSLAREAAQHDPRLLEVLDQLVCTASENDFLELLPGLRLAFTFFTPLEKHKIADTLFTPEINPTPAHTNETYPNLDQHMAEVIQRFGLRGAHHWDAQSPPNTDHAPTESAPAEPTQACPTSPALDPEARLSRWQLILGADASDNFPPMAGTDAQRNRLLGFLYDREYGPGRNVRAIDRAGGLGESQLSVPDWINGVHALFPRRTIERLEKDALDRYQLEEIVTRPEILRRAQPSVTLLKAVLRTQHLMNAEVLTAARDLIRRVVQDLIEKLAREIRAPFLGTLDRRRRSFLKIAKNFDAQSTLRKNLKHYDPIRQRLIIQEPIFYSRIRRQVDRWKIIILVDQSGSMLDSVIHAAVTASIFHQLNQVKTHLVAFDTQLIDLTDAVEDPVETLMKVQLGGGTDICNALIYANGLIEDPRRTLVILVTDFFEGGPPEHLLAAAKTILDGGTHLLGLAALDRDANPNFDRQMAAQLVKLGAQVGAMTPGELAAWIAEKVR